MAMCRERWWVVLTAAALGPIPLRELPHNPFPAQIRHVLPKDLEFPEEQLQQLILTPEEQIRFLKFQKDLDSMCLRRTGVCPTVLHSLGS